MSEAVEVVERLSALEANRENDVRRIGKVEDGIASIRNLGWGILGSVVTQVILMVMGLAIAWARH